MAAAAALIVFPRLAKGLSGFETGVAVMPLVQGGGESTAEHSRAGSEHEKLLASAAAIMSVLLIGSTIVTTLLIPPLRLPQADSRTTGRLRFWHTAISATGLGRSTTCPR